MQNALKMENKSHNELKFSLRLEEMGIEQNIPTALNFNIIWRGIRI